MTRPKVPADKRIRTAQACETCKRRKQKCNGLNPCNTCTKRKLSCEYRPNGASREVLDLPDEPMLKRRLLDSSSPPRHHNLPPPPLISPPMVHPLVAPAPSLRRISAAERVKVKFDTEPSSETDGEPGPIDQDLELHSRNSTISGPDEETHLLQSTRMLQDPTGRLLYVGDSASLAYLQLIRIIVQARSGTNAFTEDPDRHKILEAPTEVLDNFKPQMLPDIETTRVLTEAFFVHTSGLIEVLDKVAFQEAISAYYEKPLQSQPSFLCLLYLVLAIGIVMGNPAPNTRDEAIFREVRSQENREEYFFRTAKLLGDPVTGFEDADFWSVQALSLMAVYMLAVSKRNAAYAYFGMAVRSGFALGLHRVHENHSIFASEDVKLRRNLWRSLFVLDKFLSASLGRPAAIAEDECAPDALLVYEKQGNGEESKLVVVTNASSGLDAAVRSCQIIGQILKKIYARRRITVRLAAEIADHCKAWSNGLHASLDFLQPQARGPSSSTAALHVNLLYAHSVILLTRPFFICLLMKVHNERSGLKLRQTRWHNKMTKYCHACFLASEHTINLVYIAYRRRILPQRNPFVIYFLFAACLTVLSNEFGSVYENPKYIKSIQASLEVMEHCAQTDKQAQRLCHILSAFKAAVEDARKSGAPAAHSAPIPGPGHLLTNIIWTPRKPSFSQTVGLNRPVVPRSSFSSVVSAGPPHLPPGTGASPASSAAISSNGFDATDSVGDGEVDFESFFDQMSAQPPNFIAMNGDGHGHPLTTQHGVTLAPLPHKNGVSIPFAAPGPNGGLPGYPHMAGAPFFAPGEYPRGQ